MSARSRFILLVIEVIQYGLVTIICLLLGIMLLGRSAQDWDTINKVIACLELFLSIVYFCLFILCCRYSGLLKSQVLTAWDNYLDKERS